MIDRWKSDAAAIRTILHQDWDPIGCAVPEDEYDSYVWPVLGLLQEGALREVIADYLQRTADETIGCPVPPERLAIVLDKLMALTIRDRKTPPG